MSIFSNCIHGCDVHLFALPAKRAILKKKEYLKIMHRGAWIRKDGRKNFVSKRLHTRMHAHGCRCSCCSSLLLRSISASKLWHIVFSFRFVCSLVSRRSSLALCMYVNIDTLSLACRTWYGNIPSSRYTGVNFKVNAAAAFERHAFYHNLTRLQSPRRNHFILFCCAVGCFSIRRVCDKC